MCVISNEGMYIPLYGNRKCFLYYIYCILYTVLHESVSTGGLYCMLGLRLSLLQYINFAEGMSTLLMCIFLVCLHPENHIPTLHVCTVCMCSGTMEL